VNFNGLNFLLQYICNGGLIMMVFKKIIVGVAKEVVLCVVKVVLKELENKLKRGEQNINQWRKAR